MAVMGLTLMLLTPNMVFPDSQLVVNSLLSAYRSYFAVVDAGADKHRLPYDVRQKLAPFYGLQLLEQVWYGESNFLQIADAAMTDCHSIYFPSGSGMTDIIEKGNLFNSRHRDDLKWLLHELAHCEQCSQKGGRDSYAQTWFREVALSTITQLFLDPSQVSARMLHDAMPMEKDAEQKAVRVLKQLTSAR